MDESSTHADAPRQDAYTSQQSRVDNNPHKDDPSHEEHQYLDLIREILDHGEHRPDRTGTGTLSIFAPRPMKFSLASFEDSTLDDAHTTSSTPSDPSTPRLILPLLTTKRTALKSIIHELLWFISGNTSTAPLTAAGVRIWDGNGSRAYLDSVGLTHRAEGDLGPVYGFQWRHFGAEYRDAGADYAGQGVDQLADILAKLSDRSGMGRYDRRIILSAWNPADLKKMALPPCHMFAQFYVTFPDAQRGAQHVAVGAEAAGSSPSAAAASPPTTAPPPPPASSSSSSRPRLHCQLYQRSCDMGLGVPFNIASYALLTHMLARASDLTPGTLTHVLGDAHVYVDHVEALRVQLTRQPRAFPELRLRRGGGAAGKEPVGEQGGDAQGEPEASAAETGIDGWSFDDFEVLGYKPHPAIAMKMSV